jgi:hypothetical protein
MKFKMTNLTNDYGTNNFNLINDYGTNNLNSGQLHLQVRSISSKASWTDKDVTWLDVREGDNFFGINL